MDATRFVEEILNLGVASRDQVDAAAQQPSSWRTLPARLVELGCDRGDVLAAVSGAVGLPPAPPSLFRTASYADETGVSIEVWRGILACPIASADGVVLLTTTLDAVSQAQAWGVTPVRVFVALESDLDEVLGRQEAAIANEGVVFHDAMDQMELASSGGEVDVLGLPGAPVGSDGSRATLGSLELDLEGRKPRSPSFGGIEGTPSSAAATTEGTSSRDPSSGSLAALHDDGGDDSALDRVASEGQRLCGYDIYEELGRGASAVVFRARRPGESYDVALKIITKETARNASFPQRFKREIRAQASLTHPNIVHVVDYGREDGWYYLATEYLPGGTLEDLVAQTGTLPGIVAVCVLDDVLQGIAFAQTRGVVHRDLKPGNLLLAPDGRIKIGDFGLARMDLDPNKSSFGTVQGTPAYMSPEQALGLDIDGRSDFFTLATIVYELVTGTNPYRRELGPATLMAVAQAKPLSLFDAAPGVPLELDEAVYRMSHKEPERRPATAEELLALLAPVMADVARRSPSLLPTYLQAPAPTRTRLCEELAREEVARANVALESGDDKLRPRAAVAVARALAHQPNHSEARALWSRLAESGITLGPAQKPDLIAVEQQLVDAPEDTRLLRRASELARGEGNVLKQAGYLRRYLRLGQKDTLALHQLSLLLPDDAAPRPEPLGQNRSATPTTMPSAPAQSLSSSSAAIPAAPGPAPSATAASPSASSQGIPSSRAPRVVGTGAETAAFQEPRESRSRLPALLGVLLLLGVAAAWFFLGDNAAALITSAAEDEVEERIDESATDPAPVVVNPFAQRQLSTLREARAHVDGGRLDKAIEGFTAAIDMDPGSKLAMEGWLGRAEAYVKKGDKETAVKQYRRMLELTSEGAYGHAEAQAALKALGAPAAGGE